VEPSATDQEINPRNRGEGLGNFGRQTGEFGTVKQAHEDDEVVKWDDDGRTRFHQPWLKKLEPAISWITLAGANPVSSRLSLSHARHHPATPTDRMKRVCNVGYLGNAPKSGHTKTLLMQEDKVLEGAQHYCARN
jgi:hypothetical protein